MGCIELAREFAIREHGTQKRKYTFEPYWHHLDEVANITSEYVDDESVIAAAWLHDVLEDTEITASYLKDYFDSRIVEMVEDLTDGFDLSYGNRAKRKSAYAKQLHNAKHDYSHTIKCADIISNTETIVEYDPKFAKIYLKETEKMLPLLNRADYRILRRARELVTRELIWNGLA